MVDKIIQMVLEIGIGLLLGLLLAGWFAYWLSRRAPQSIGEETMISTVQKATLSEYPVAQQLRHALYDCEQQQKQCGEQLQVYWLQQLALVNEVANVNHVEVKGKPLFFAYRNQINQENYFYYERDIKQKVLPNRLSETKALLEQYQQKIELLWTQYCFFEQLVASHQQNLDRLAGKEESQQWQQKVAAHQARLQQEKVLTEAEQKAIYSELLLEQIQEEVDYQEEYVQQYHLLLQQQNTALPTEAKQRLKIEIETLIEQLENKDPRNF